MYKSTDAGKTWTHLGLRDSQMIAMIDVDPDESRTGSSSPRSAIPYGPNAERGIFRSTDGGQTFEKVLYKDEYTSGNDVRIDPADPNIVYATLWQQQQSFSEGSAFGGAGNGIFKSTDGGTTWKQLTDGLPTCSRPTSPSRRATRSVLYATRRPASAPAGAAAAAAPRAWSGFYKSTDGGEHWFRAIDGPDGDARGNAPADPRPLVRIGGGDLPTVAVDPKNENVVYSSLHRVLAHRGRRPHLVGGARRARAATTTRRSGSTRTTPTSSSSSPTRAAWCRPIAASRGATGTRSPRRRCTT